MNTTKRKSAVTIGGKTYKRKRSRHTPSTNGRLSVNPELLDFDNFAYRWMNDEQNGRISIKSSMEDWEFVPNIGVKEDSTDLGDMVSYPVGTNKDGSAKVGYLMRKPKTFYEEDQADKQAALEKQLQQLRTGASGAGEVQSDYVPHAGINIR